MDTLIYAAAQEPVSPYKSGSTLFFFPSELIALRKLTIFGVRPTPLAEI